MTKNNKKKQRHPVLLQSLIIRSWWAIFSFFHWQRMSSVGIVCRSWCYIRKYEMKEFVVWNISPCGLRRAATSIRGALKACYYDCVVAKMKQLGQDAEQVQKHACTRCFFCLFILAQTSVTLSCSLFHTNTDVHNSSGVYSEIHFTIDSCAWYDLSSRWQHHRKQTNLSSFKTWWCKMYIHSL